MNTSPRSAQADTTILALYSFDSGGICDDEDWTAYDLTAQLDTYFHVAGFTELDGGTFGGLLPIDGDQSMWCGVDDGPSVPYCGYATLPGYGNGWDQSLESKEFSCDSLRVFYNVCWDSEAGYDVTKTEHFDNGGLVWVPLPVNGGAGQYEGSGCLLGDTLAFPVSGGSTRLRIRFLSDGTGSDEDGGWPSDGAVIMDDLMVECYNSGVLSETCYNDFEPEAPGATATLDGCWSATVPAGFGDFAFLYPGLTVTQEDICRTELTCLWGFFDDPLATSYACGGWPSQGAVPYGPDPDGFYIQNEIWSPSIPLAGTGNEVTLSFDVYKDLPLDNLVFFSWRVRSVAAGCPGVWRDHGYVYYGGHKFWLTLTESIGDLIEPGATDIQIALGAVDMCRAWCGIMGTGACHSHAPLYDNVQVLRIDTSGPQWGVRHVDLFQDNFADDGTLSGTARADMALDILPATNPGILPGDSVVVNVSDPGVGLGTDPHTGSGPAVYAYVAVWPQSQPGKDGPSLEAPETAPYVGIRYPLVDSLLHDGNRWYCYRMDSVRTAPGFTVPDAYAFDLNDAVFTPGDTICYVFGAANWYAQSTYFSRRLNGQGESFTTGDRAEALSSPMEFTILPAGGWLRGGDILYVDDADDRGGPTQIHFDSVFDLLQIRDLVDRYDILDPSCIAGNSLASRVRNVAVQIIGPYRKIIWNSANRESGLIGDGTGAPKKSDDFGLLYTFLDQSTDEPGLYISGDDIAEEWSILPGASALLLRSIYMNFNLVNADHSIGTSEPISPLLVGTPGGCFDHVPGPDSLLAHGGCPVLNGFDLLQATGSSVAELTNPLTGNAYVLSQVTPNSAASTARVILSGFSFHEIRGLAPGFPTAQAEHMTDIINWLQNMVTPTGIDPSPQFVSYLDTNYPNPFNPETTIGYGTSERGHVTLTVYNVAGQLVKTLVNEVQDPGSEHRVIWSGDNNHGQPVASGVYFYRLTAKNFSQTRKMVLLR